MTDSVIEFNDEKVLNDDTPDAALEIAGSRWGDGAAASVTAAFWQPADPHPGAMFIPFKVADPRVRRNPEWSWPSRLRAANDRGHHAGGERKRPPTNLRT
jgi:hypothetical protein